MQANRLLLGMGGGSEAFPNMLADVLGHTYQLHVDGEAYLVGARGFVSGSPIKYTIDESVSYTNPEFCAKVSVNPAYT